MIAPPDRQARVEEIANLDSLETRDHRLLLDHTCFSVEPGIYLAGASASAASST